MKARTRLSVVNRALPVLALACLALGAAVAHAKEVRWERLVLAMGGHEVGTTEVRDFRTPEGFRFERASDLRIVRGSTVLKIKTKTESFTDANLRPLRWRFEKTDASGTLVSEGELRGGKAIVRTTQAGATVENVLDAPKDLLLATALDRKLRTNLQRLAGKPAQTYPVLVEDMGAITPMKVSVRKDGVGYVITTSFAGVTTEDYVDDKGRTLRSETPALSAVAYPVGAAPPKSVQQGDIDVLARSTWKAPRLSRSVKRVRYRVHTPDAKTFDIPEDDRQRVKKRTAKFVEVEVTDAPSVRRGLTASERKTMTSATPYEPTGDPRLRATVAEVTKSATSERDKVARLTQWVYEHVEEKGLDRGYAPALATLESGAGDCTEHSVLLSALLRSAGIPTRLVDGVVVSGGRAGYHEWVEVEVDGQVVPADPTFGEFPASPARLKLAEGSSAPDGLLRLGVAAGRLLRPGVRVEVVSSD